MHRGDNIGNMDIARARQHVLQLSTNVKDPATLDSRIFVGNLDRKSVNREHLYLEFSRFGEIIAIGRLMKNINENKPTFAFVQFSTSQSAAQAAMVMDGTYFYGNNMEVKLASFRNGEAPYEQPRLVYHDDHYPPVMVTNQQVQSRATANSSASFVEQNGSAVVKKRSTVEAHNSRPKKLKTGPDVGQTTPVVPDILVCGNCHQNFSDIEIMINHKRRPCQPKVRCRCKADNVPNSVTCAICYNELPTPWKLIQHIHKIHNLRICHNINGVNVAGENREELTEVDHGDQVEDCVDAVEDEELLDPDNDLIDDEDAAMGI